ncbi:MAG: hypothetical protein KA731_02010 [Candidatus Moranbacteria bacterium]|nr:hypothetical protein [Candidatus Moranbacteria bacterium]MBP7696020.1 hypothetical protein [Candidatus Moranbacteria bacterium]
MAEIRMEEGTTETVASQEGDACPHCAKHAQEAAENHESSLAFLLALMPLIVLTFFGQVGLL